MVSGFDLSTGYMGMFILQEFPELHYRFFALMLIFKNIALQSYLCGLRSIVTRGERLTCLTLVPALWGWNS